MLRLVQEDLERARQWRLEKQQVQPVQQPPPPPPQPTMTNGNNNNTATVPDQERMRKIEAFQRKQRELEATQAAEERIIREAQRRKEEEIHRQVQQPPQWRPAPGNIPAPPPATSSTNQRLDNLIHQPSTEVAATTKRVSFFQETTTSTSREDTDVITLFFSD